MSHEVILTHIYIYRLTDFLRYNSNVDEKVSEYYQEIPQSHNADQPTAPLGRVTEHLQ